MTEHDAAECICNAAIYARDRHPRCLFSSGGGVIGGVIGLGSAAAAGSGAVIPAVAGGCVAGGCVGAISPELYARARSCPESRMMQAARRSSSEMYRNIHGLFGHPFVTPVVTHSPLAAAVAGGGAIAVAASGASKESGGGGVMALPNAGGGHTSRKVLDSNGKKWTEYKDPSDTWYVRKIRNKKGEVIKTETVWELP